MWFSKNKKDDGEKKQEMTEMTTTDVEKGEGDQKQATTVTTTALENKPQVSVQVPQVGPPREVGNTAATPNFSMSWGKSVFSSESDDKAGVATLSPFNSRRPNQVGSMDPFTDDAAASQPVTPASERSLEEDIQTPAPTWFPAHPPRRSSMAPSRKASTVGPHSLEVPEPQYRRKSSTADPFSDRKSSSSSDEETNARGDSVSQYSRKSSIAVPPPAVTYNMSESRDRRRSSTIDPHSAIPQSARKMSEAGHPRTDRPHITFQIPEDEAVHDVDAITLANPPPTAKMPLFNQEFTLNGARRASDSMQNQHLLSDEDTYHPGMQAGRRKSSCVLVNRRASKYTIEEEKVVRQVGKKRLYWTKIGVIIGFIVLNCGFSAITWVEPKYWYVFAPVILLGNFLNTVMVLNLIRSWLQENIVKAFRYMTNRTKALPPTEIPTTIAMVLACYCESYEDLMNTIDSLSEQERIEHHKRMFIVICDGQVKGKGMEKSTDRILVEDIFKPDEEIFFPVGYESWDGVVNGIYASAGTYNGIPYCCIVKKRNLGKRDGLILVRTLLYKYQERHDNPVSSMGSDFFEWFCNFSESHGIDKFEWLVGVDADTTFNKECIYELHKDCVANPDVIGSSGLIQVGWNTGNWNPWNIYQNTEYMRSQCLRRLHQARGTGKVSCLPGACQIIKICEESCGDKILIDLFGQIPDPKGDMIKQVRALAGEDRNYICLIFFNSPHVNTTMSMKAIAYTDPPNAVSVFLSQRKRWTLSTCANDMLIISKKQMNWFERVCSTADVLCWFVPFFILQTFALFVRACINLENPSFLLGFATLTIVPLTYDLFVVAWACHGIRYRLQYLVGLLMVVVLSQFVTPIVIAYAIWHMDDFSWGKTREIEDSGDPEKKPAHSD